MSPRASLGDLEASVMGVLWAAAAPMTVREVLDRLTDRDPAYTTVMTVLDRLTKKSMLERELDGRAWRYRPVSTREELTADALRSTLQGLGVEQRRTTMLHFLDEASPAEIAELRAALDDLA